MPVRKVGCIPNISIHRDSGKVISPIVPFRPSQSRDLGSNHLFAKDFDWCEAIFSRCLKCERFSLMDRDVTAWSRSVSSSASKPTDSDSELARLIADGDVEAWDRFFDRYSGWAYRFSYCHLNRNHADAEDLCSDILMVAAGSIDKFDVTRGSLDVWLLGLARHRLAKFCRRRHVEIPSSPDFSSNISEEENFQSITDRILTRESVNRALASLPERQSTVLIEKYVEEYSMEEIARIEGTTEKAVESLLSRARKSFRIALRGLVEISERGAVK